MTTGFTNIDWRKKSNWKNIERFESIYKLKLFINVKALLNFINRPHNVSDVNTILIALAHMVYLFLFFNRNRDF